MTQHDFDIAVIGAGPAGYHAAIRASQLGKKVALIEKDDGSGIAGMGGVCLNWGCIPSKSLLKNAEFINQISESEKWGISFDNLNVDFQKAVKRSREVSSSLTQGIRYLINKNKISLFEDTAKFISNETIKLINSEDIIKASNFIIATGARPKSLPNLEIDKNFIITSREALDLKEAPESIGIIGAGAIGVEFAYLFHSYSSEVMLFEMLPHLVPNEDEDVSIELEKSFSNRGIKFATNCKVLGTSINGNKVVIKYEQDGSESQYECEKVLLGVGVQPNTDNLGLDEIGINLEKGFISVDDNMLTNIKNIYAVGDVTGKLMLAHVGFSQGAIAAEHASGSTVHPLDYKELPRCTYCQPQIASIGLTEKEARDSGRSIKTAKFPFKAVGKAIAIGDSEGFVKLVTDDESGELIGAHLIGPEVTELIAEIGILKLLEGTNVELGMLTHAHPTLSEALKEAGLAISNEAIHF